MMGIINQLSKVKPSWLRSLGWACLNFAVKLSRDTELKKPVEMQLTKWLGFNKITIWLEHHWNNWNIIILRLFYDLIFLNGYFSDIQWNLVGGLEHGWIMTFHSVGKFIIPTGEVHHFSEGLKPTTNQELPWTMALKVTYNIIPLARMITQQNQGICNLFIWINDPTFQVSELPSGYLT